jgi:hypothetical protein
MGGGVKAPFSMVVLEESDMKHSIKTSLTINNETLQHLKKIRIHAAHMGFPCDSHEDTLRLLFKTWAISEENGVVTRLLKVSRTS